MRPVLLLLFLCVAAVAVFVVRGIGAGGTDANVTVAVGGGADGAVVVGGGSDNGAGGVNGGAGSGGGSAGGAIAYEPNELPKYNGEVAPRIKRERGLSLRAVNQGWGYFYAGDDLTAMRRFNQAWMLDSRNPNALWGMGAVVMNRARVEAAKPDADAARVQVGFAEGMDLMRQAQVLAPDNGRLLGDLGFSLGMQGSYLQSIGKDGSAQLLEAEQQFTRALEIEPDYPPTLANYAVLKHHTGDYPAALDYAAKAEALGYVLPESFKQKLRQLPP